MTPESAAEDEAPEEPQPSKEVEAPPEIVGPDNASWVEVARRWTQKKSVVSDPSPLQVWGVELREGTPCGRCNQAGRTSDSGVEHTPRAGESR